MPGISIADLKSSKDKPTTPKEQPKGTGKNVDGKKLRDFGNGLKEFDPVANGFSMEPKDKPEPDDITKALSMFADQMEERNQTVAKYNELLDQYGGAITEEELRAELGESAVTKILDDGEGGKYEDFPGQRMPVDEYGRPITDQAEDSTTKESNKNDNSKTTVIDEDAELERELANEPSFITNTVEVQQGGFSMEKNTTPVEIKKEEPKFVAKEETPNKKVVLQDTAKAEDAVKHAAPIVEEPKELADNSLLSGSMEIKERKEHDESEEDKDMAALEDDGLKPPVDDFNEKLKKEIEKKMRPVSRKFDLSNVVIFKEPITVNNAMNKYVQADRKTFTWALYNTKVPITMRSFTATELERLNEIARDNTRNKEVFQFIYDHVVSPRSADFTRWAKCVSYYDVDHIWFSIYCACYADSNYLPFTCNNCRELTVTTDTPISDMVTFKDDEVKAEHTKIRTHPADPSMVNKFPEYLLQVSDTLVFGFREPSIYDAVIAPGMFDNDFTTKYEDIIGVAAYISNIYSIDYERGGLAPIATKTFVNNEVKTAKARIIQYSKIIRSLSSDQYNVVVKHVTTMNNDNPITYGLPAITCEHCKKEIPGERMAAYDLVFIRHRLGVLGA